jgi:hypothetical protein
MTTEKNGNTLTLRPESKRDREVIKALHAFIAAPLKGPKALFTMGWFSVNNKIQVSWLTRHERI